MTKEQVLNNYLNWFIPQLNRSINKDEEVDYKSGKHLCIRIYPPPRGYKRYEDGNFQTTYVFDFMVVIIKDFFPPMNKEDIEEIILRNNLIN